MIGLLSCCAGRFGFFVQSGHLHIGTAHFFMKFAHRISGYERVAIITAALLLCIPESRAAMVIDNNTVTVPPNISANDLVVGEFGNGSLSISNGGTVSLTGWAVIGEASGATGRVTVSGNSSTWTANGGIHVSNTGNGALVIENGASVVLNSYITIGRNTGGVGELVITSGGTLTSNRGELGFVGGNATVTIMGAGSSWTNTGNLSLSGTGTLSLLDGGTLRNAQGSIATQSGSTVAVTVRGAGSKWTNNNNVIVGNGGNGTLTIGDGGEVTASSLTIASIPGSTGTLNIGAAAGDAAVAPGVLTAGSILFGSGSGNIVFNHTDTDYEFASALVGNGTVSFLSGTTELISDQSAFSGTSTVTDASTLTVHVSLGGTTIVADGGTLKGNGTLGNVTVNNNGTIAPGNSIGITNAGNVTFTPGSTYEVELNSAMQSDRINATGTATLTGGTVEAIAFPDYTLGSAYTILTATGGVTGTFDSSTFSEPFISSLLSYDTNNVYLTLAPNSTAVDHAVQTPNQRAVAAVTGAQAASLSFAGDLYTSADEATFRAGLDSLSGEIHASTAGALIAEQQRLRASILSGTGRHDTTLTLGDTIFWAQGSGSFGSTGGTANTARMTHNNAGTLIGAERHFDDRRAGVAIGASSSHMEQDGRNSKAASDNIHLLAYTGNKGGVGKTQHTVGGSLSLHSIDTRRNVTANSFSGHSTADHSGRTAEAFAEIAHPLAAGGKATLSPYLQGAVTVQQQDGFTETGEAGLTAGTSTTRVASTTLGARYDHPFEVGGRRTLHASLSAAWQHLYGDDTPDTTLGFTQAPADRFSVQGAPLARDAALFSASLTTSATDNLALAIGYDASLASELTAHAFTARGEYRF